MRINHRTSATLIGASALAALALGGTTAAVTTLADPPPICYAANPGNLGTGNTGAGNPGNTNIGSGNTGDRNTGYGNTGDGNRGYGNTMDGNVGSGDTPYVSPVAYGSSGYGVGPDGMTTCP